MKLKAKNKSRNNLYIVAVVVVILAILGIVLYVFFTNQSSERTPEYPTTDSNNSSTGTSNEDSTKSPSSSNETSTPSDEIPVSEAGAVTITNLNQKSGYVNVLATVSNFTPTQCVYTFTSEGSKPVTRAQDGSCSGVSIPQEEFDKIGTYTLTVSVYGQGEKLTATKDIYVQ